MKESFFVLIWFLFVLSLEQCVSGLKLHRDHLKILSGRFLFSKFELDLRFCIFKKLPGDAAAHGPRVHIVKSEAVGDQKGLWIEDIWKHGPPLSWWMSF